MKLIKSKKALVLLATLAVAVAAAVGAYAYFSSTGHGASNATVGTSTPFTVSPDAAPTGDALLPGSGMQSVQYDVTNDSDGNQNLANVNISIAGTDQATGDPTVWSVAGSPDCTASDFELSLNGTVWAAPGASVNDTALAGDLDGHATTDKSKVYIRMIDTQANQDACQGATVPLYFSAS